MSKIIRRLRDAPNEAMKPIVQELEDLASVAEGRFTAGIKVIYNQWHVFQNVLAQEVFFLSIF